MSVAAPPAAAVAAAVAAAPAVAPAAVAAAAVAAAGGVVAAAAGAVAAASAASVPRVLKPAGIGDVTSSWCRRAHGNPGSGSRSPGLRQRVSWSAD